MPRASIVIPAFRNADHLAETLASALGQTYADLEVVIADHSSDDDTAAVIDRFADDPRLRILSPTPAGGGAKANWDRVSQAAGGELLKLLPGDDLIHPTLVERQVAGFDAHPTVAVSCTNRSMVDASGKVFMSNRGLPRDRAGLRPGVELVRACVRAGTNVLGEPGAVMLRRDLLERAGWWDDAQPYLIDVRSYLGALAVGMAEGRSDVWVITEPLARFRVSAGQWSVRLAGEQAAMTRAFNAHLRERHPEAVSAADVALGDVRAQINAWGRQVVYRLLGSRMA